MPQCVSEMVQVSNFYLQRGAVKILNKALLKFGRKPKRLQDFVMQYVLNVFIDIQTSKELIQMDTDKMMTYGTYTMDDEKLTQS